MKPLFPKKGTADTTIKRLVSYLKQNYLYPQNIAGVSSPLIQKYIQLSNIATIPVVYQHYLETFGKNNGGIIDNALDIDLEMVIDYYEDISESNPEYLKKEYPIFAIYYISGDEICLDIKKNSQNPPLILAPCGEKIDMISSSLENYLMFSAILYVEKRKRKYGFWFSNSPYTAKNNLPQREKIGQSAFNEINILAQKMNLEKVGFSDSNVQIFVSPNTSLIGKIGKNNRIFIYLFSDEELNPKLFASIKNTFGTKTETKI